MEKKTGILNTFIRYGKLLFVFLKMSLMAQLEYRINFAAGVLVETGWLLIKLLYVAVVYRAGIKIGVLTPDHILLFIGVYILLTGVYMLYYPNFTSLTTMIRDGKLDMYLVKPVAAQFLVTMQRLDLSLLVPDAAAGIVMIGIGWHRAGLPVTVGSIAGFLFFLICGALLTYSLFLLPHLLVFWTTATNGIADLTAAVYRNISAAGVCHHELSGPVSDGRVVCSDGGLGRRCTSRVLFDRTGGVESGGEELYVGEHVRSF